MQGDYRRRLIRRYEQTGYITPDQLALIDHAAGVVADALILWPIIGDLILPLVFEQLRPLIADVAAEVLANDLPGALEALRRRGPGRGVAHG
jgi:hypothetical protein